MKPHLGLAGAFSFPWARGSQWLLAEQARALAEAGVRVTTVCYARGDGRPAPGIERLLRIGRTWTPRRTASALGPRKLLADVALAARLRAAHREDAFDAVLAHNAEAALAAFLAFPGGRLPIVYVAHTLWAREASSYLPERSPGALRRGADALGAALDATCARRAHATLVLTRAAELALSARAAGPIERVPPGHRCEPPPTPEAVAASCARHDLVAGSYAVYAGNLDRYQALEELDRAAAALPHVPCVAVTHDREAPRFRALRVVRVDATAEMRALLRGARLAVLPRRREGGFPLKLLSYLEAGLPVVARAPLADTLVHAESAWLVPGSAPADALAGAVARLHGDEGLRRRIGAGGRAALRDEHGWPARADQTLLLVARARARASSHLASGR